MIPKHLHKNDYQTCITPTTIYCSLGTWYHVLFPGHAKDLNVTKWSSHVTVNLCLKQVLARFCQPFQGCKCPKLVLSIASVSVNEHNWSCLEHASTVNVHNWLCPGCLRVVNVTNWSYLGNFRTVNYHHWSFLGGL